MRVVVCLKRVPDTAEADVKVDDSARSIVEDRLEFTINEADSYALEEALLIRERHQAEVTLVTVGSKSSEEILRMGLAKGADGAVRIEPASIDQSDALSVARLLAGWLRGREFDLVLTGCITSDVADSQVGPTLAQLLELPHAAYTVASELNDAGVQVKRELEGGLLEVKQLPLPCVLSIQTGGNTPRYASVLGIKRARGKPLDEIQPSSIGVGSVEPGTELVRIFVPEVTSSAEMIEGCAEDKAARIAAILRERGLL